MEDIVKQFSEMNDVLKNEVLAIYPKATDRSLIDRFKHAFNQLEQNDSLEEMDSLYKHVYSEVEKIRQGPIVPKTEAKQEYVSEVAPESARRPTRKAFQRANEKTKEHLKLSLQSKMRQDEDGSVVIVKNENKNNVNRDSEIMPAPKSVKRVSRKKKTNLSNVLTNVKAENIIESREDTNEVAIIEQKINVIEIDDKIETTEPLHIDSETKPLQNGMVAVQPSEESIQVMVDDLHQEDVLKSSSHSGLPPQKMAPSFYLSVIQEEESVNMTAKTDIKETTAVDGRGLKNKKNSESNKSKIIANSKGDTKSNKTEAAKKAKLRKRKANSIENINEDEEHESTHNASSESENRNDEPEIVETEADILKNITNVNAAVNETFCRRPCLDQTVVLSKPGTTEKEIITRLSNLDIDQNITENYENFKHTVKEYEAKAKSLDETHVITRAPMNETIILSKPKSSNSVCIDNDETDDISLINTTRVLDATRVINKSALGKTDVINKKSPLRLLNVQSKQVASNKKVAALANEKKNLTTTKTKQLFSPYAKNTLRNKVEAFEKLAEGGGGLKTTRVTPASSRILKPTSVTSLANKSKNTPENCNQLPSSIGSEKTTKILGNYKPAGYVRKEKEEQAIKKREALLQKQTEEKRRMRELREQKAKKAREAQEKIKQEALEVQRRKLEEHAQRFALRQEQLAKQLEMKEHQRQLAKQRYEAMQNTKPRYLTEKPPLLATVDCYDTDDEDRPQIKSSDLPQWNRKQYMEVHLRCARYIDSQVINSLFGTKPQTPNLQELMPSVSEDKLRRKSSAIWKKAPRFTMIQPVEEQF